MLLVIVNRRSIANASPVVAGEGQRSMVVLRFRGFDTPTPFYRPFTHSFYLCSTLYLASYQRFSVDTRSLCLQSVDFP